MGEFLLMSISSHAEHGPNNGRPMPTGDYALDNQTK